jgi:hypothetical protein
MFVSNDRPCIEYDASCSEKRCCAGGGGAGGGGAGGEKEGGRPCDAAGKDVGQGVVEEAADTNHLTQVR